MKARSAWLLVPAAAVALLFATCVHNERTRSPEPQAPPAASDRLHDIAGRPRLHPGGLTPGAFEAEGQPPRAGTAGDTRESGY